MVIITHSKLNLNVKIKNNDIVIAVQNDSNTRYLDIVLLDGTTPINLSSKTVRLYARKPDGTEVYNNAVIRNATGGRVEVLMTNQLLAKVGMVTAQIVISQGATTILTSLPFQIHVVENLFNTSTVQSSNEYGSLVVMYQDLIQAHQQMQTIINTMGQPSDLTNQLGLNTVFKGFNYIINYLHTNSVAGIANKVDLIKQNTDLLSNSNYGLSNIRNMLDRNLNNTKGDILGRQVSIAKLTFKKPSGNTSYSNAVYYSDIPAMITFIDFSAKKSNGFPVGATCKITLGGNTTFNIPASSEVTDIMHRNVRFPIGGSTVRIDILGSNMPTEECTFEIEIHSYR